MYKAVLLSVGAGILLLLIAAAIIGRARSIAPDGLGRRVLAHTQDRSDYRILVGVPTTNPTAWAEVATVDDATVTLSDGQTLDLREVTAYVVAYPSGALVDYYRPDTLPMPNWVGGLERAKIAESDELELADFKEGQSLLRVEFGSSTARPESPDHYSTTLTNISDQPVRVLKFAGYTRIGSKYVLNTVTGRFFSAAEFKEWYGQADEWIAPGQSVTDPNNYGSPPVLWAYHVEAKDGQRFITGGVLE